MRTDKVFHVISNTHWDREWRFPFQRNRQMLVDMIDSVLDILVKEPKYRAFHLDSQSIVLRDYLEVNPHKKKLIVKLVKENRLLIGPWYILPEEFQVGGENLIRNLFLFKKGFLLIQIAFTLIALVNFVCSTSKVENTSPFETLISFSSSIIIF